MLPSSRLRVVIFVDDDTKDFTSTTSRCFLHDVVHYYSRSVVCLFVGQVTVKGSRCRLGRGLGLPEEPRVKWRDGIPPSGTGNLEEILRLGHALAHRGPSTQSYSQGGSTW